MIRLKVSLLLVLASMLLWVEVGEAESFHYRMTGRVWNVVAAPSGSDVESLFSIGDTYELEFSYDNSNETPRPPGNTLGQFFPPIEVSITYSSGYHAEAYSGRIVVANNQVGEDSFYLEMIYNDPVTWGPVLSGPDVGNSQLVLLQLALVDFSASALQSVDLGPLPLLSAFGQRSVIIAFYNQYGQRSDFKATVDTLEVTVTDYSCSGFGAPMATYPVKAKKNRVFPLKFELFDEAGFELSDSDITASPVVQVIFTPLNGVPIDVTASALSSGAGSEGNQFDYVDEGNWQFNLKSSNYTAEGEYLVTAVSGDESEYTIDPACITSFAIEN